MAKGNISILLTMFGTSIATALPALMNIRSRVQARFEHTSVHLAFTSATIRRIWNERAADREYRAAHPEVSKDVFAVRSPSAMIDFLARQAMGALVVQPVRIAPSMDDIPGEGYLPDKISAGVMPGNLQIAVGRPVLGPWNEHHHKLRDDVAEVVRSLQADIDLARRNRAALFYMGHGNKYSSTHSIYAELVQAMRRRYPDVRTVMSMVAGNDLVPAIVSELKENSVHNVILKPFMVVAGAHVRKEMVGAGPASLKIQLEKEGMTVYPVLEGLGSNDAFADIFAHRTADAAREAGIELV